MSDRYEFYGPQYARFASPLIAEVRREAYGADLGQQSWRSLEEDDQLADLLERHSPCHLLDIGCGSAGPSLALAARTGCRLTGIDVEPAAIAQARARSAAAGLDARAEFLEADSNRPLPFGDGTVDVMACIDAIIHLEDRSRALADWFRLLRPGGRLFVTDAGVLTGPVTKAELDVRASQGPCVFVPPGWTEDIIARIGFRLLRSEDTTGSMAVIVKSLHDARERRSAGLQAEEGSDWFAKRQRYLAVTGELAAERRLSRFLYVAERPA